MRAHKGSIPLWSLHAERLTRSAGLGGDVLKAITTAVSSAAERTRSWPHGARVRLRYGLVAGASAQTPRWDIEVAPLAECSPWDNGALLGICDTRLSTTDTQSPFARFPVDSSSGSVQRGERGCKLLSRNTYERAASEWAQAASGCGPLLEPLLLDPAGMVIEGVRSNLLVRTGSHWLTPRLDEFGVRGVMLRWLAGQTEIGEDVLQPSDLERAEELAICNSVRGVIPAKLLGDDRNTPVGTGAATAALRGRISEKLW